MSSNPRAVSAAGGSDITAKSWQTEAVTTRREASGGHPGVMGSTDDQQEPSHRDQDPDDEEINIVRGYN